MQSSDYHVGVVRSQLTRNLGARFSDVVDEIATAFEDLVPAKDNGGLLTLLCTGKLDLLATARLVIRSRRFYNAQNHCENEQSILCRPSSM